MPMYIYRWPNGDWSAVSAKNRKSAALLLDEVGLALPSELIQAKDFMIHLKLDDTPATTADDCERQLFQYEGLGERFEGQLDRLYPHLDAYLNECLTDDGMVHNPEALQRGAAVGVRGERVHRRGSGSQRTGSGRTLQGAGRDNRAGFAEDWRDTLSGCEQWLAKERGYSHSPPLFAIAEEVSSFT